MVRVYTLLEVSIKMIVFFLFCITFRLKKKKDRLQIVLSSSLINKYRYGRKTTILFRKVYYYSTFDIFFKVFKKVRLQTFLFSSLINKYRYGRKTTILVGNLYYSIYIWLFFEQCSFTDLFVFKSYK